MARRGASVVGIAPCRLRVCVCVCVYVCVNLKVHYNHHMIYCNSQAANWYAAPLSFVHPMTQAKPNFSFALDLHYFIILYCA